jgi:hypothetical protein
MAPFYAGTFLFLILVSFLWAIEPKTK